ncbi:hypothetical protein AWC24_00085 [Mycolicibacter senuensis]|uniref:Uncharacterized protein n=2 Tax=Mycolicibacter senuensis TaxID=386913 RepID=A0A7I9XPF2_9MYCO|nr:hypothetical protein AWC24_00085 [Mycolicibacter senuensis]GFG71326.1 hypothetical protein MSEN_30460 [Mycolicibacter senuensis]
MIHYPGIGARVGALALALGTGVAAVQGGGIATAAAGVDSAAMAAPAGDSLLSAVVQLLALSYVDYYDDPWIEAETAMERELGSMYINQYFSISPVDTPLYDMMAQITQQPVFPSLLTGDYGPSDAYMVAWQTDPGTGIGYMTGAWKMDVGVPLYEERGYGHDVVFFDKGFYPQIFTQIPGFAPEFGDHAFPSYPGDPGDPGGPGDVTGFPDPLKDIVAALAPPLRSEDLETLLANLEAHPLGATGLDELLQSLGNFNGDVGRYLFNNYSSIVDILANSVKNAVGAYNLQGFLSGMFGNGELTGLGLKLTGIGYLSAVALQVDKDTIGMILANKDDFSLENIMMVAQNNFLHPDQAVSGLMDGIQVASNNIATEAVDLFVPEWLQNMFG